MIMVSDFGGADSFSQFSHKNRDVTESDAWLRLQSFQKSDDCPNCLKYREYKTVNRRICGGKESERQSVFEF